MDIPQLEISPNIYYTPEEVASLLRVSRRSGNKLLETGVARGVKIGRYWRVLGSDLLLLPHADEMNDNELTLSLMRLSEPAFKENSIS